MGKTRRNKAKHDRYDDAVELDAQEHVYHAWRCQGKLAYKTRAKAMRAKRNDARKFGKKYRAYQCPYCSYWHLTTHGWRGSNGVEGKA